jgi:hypothetical protein
MVSRARFTLNCQKTFFSFSVAEVRDVLKTVLMCGYVLIPAGKKGCRQDFHQEKKAFSHQKANTVKQLVR